MPAPPSPALPHVRRRVESSSTGPRRCYQRLPRRVVKPQRLSRRRLHLAQRRLPIPMRTRCRLLRRSRSRRARETPRYVPEPHIGAPPFPIALPHVRAAVRSRSLAGGSAPSAHWRAWRTKCRLPRRSRSRRARETPRRAPGALVGVPPYPIAPPLVRATVPSRSLVGGRAPSAQRVWNRDAVYVPVIETSVLVERLLVGVPGQAAQRQRPQAARDRDCGSPRGRSCGARLHVAIGGRRSVSVPMTVTGARVPKADCWSDVGPNIRLLRVGCAR